jgi:hypothetical protein
MLGSKSDSLMSLSEETIMKNRKLLLDEIFETALQNDMTYFG